MRKVFLIARFIISACVILFVIALIIGLSGLNDAFSGASYKPIEEEYEIKIFHSGKKTLSLTPEGEVLVKYAKRLMAIEQKLTHALEDSKNSVRRYNVGTTTTVGEYVVSQLFITYCSEHPGSHINIVTDNMNNLLNKLQSYELDWAIVDGRFRLRVLNPFCWDRIICAW